MFLNFFVHIAPEAWFYLFLTIILYDYSYTIYNIV